MVNRMHQSVQCRRANVAGNRRAATSGTAQGTGQCGGGGLAIAAGNRNHLRLWRPLAQAAGKQFDFGNHRNAKRHRFLNQWFLPRNTGRNGDQLNPGKGCRRKLAGKQGCLGHGRSQGSGSR